jgi:TonB-dependent starch-binding outer membrane protein SusC
MKKKLRLTGKILLMMAVFCCTARLQAQAHNGEEVQNDKSQKTSLKEVIDELNTKYDAFFLYETNLIENKYVAAENAQLTNLDQDLARVLLPLGLKYEKQTDNLYVITAEKQQKSNQKIEKKSINYNEGMDERNLSRLETRTGLRNMKVAQNFTVRGRVTAQEDNQPLPGVNILVRGTSIGTITDATGNFTLNAPDGNGTLVFSFIGYTTEEVPINNRSMINVSMIPDIAQLGEVVVVGYSTQQKRDITGAVSIIDANQLRKTPAPSFAQQLQGRAAGVQVGSSGAPGAGTTIRIRGVGSVNDNSPLLVIDGVSTRSQDFNSINPNDIESIQILKDASAASIYGAQASNGVVIITTKKGTKSGAPRISYDSYVGAQRNANWYNMMNTDEFSQYLRTALQNNITMRDLVEEDGTPQVPKHRHFGAGSAWSVPDYLTPSRAMDGQSGTSLADYTESNRITRVNRDGTNWGDALFQTGIITDHQLSALGGSEYGNYAFGMNYFKNEGTVMNTNFTRYTFRANTEFNAGKHIKLGENLMFSYTTQQGFGTNQDEGNWLSMAYRMVPYIPVHDIAGNFAGTAVGESGNAQNPVALSMRSADNQSRRQRLFGNVFAEVNIADITLRSSFGLDHRNEFYYGMTKLNPEHSEKRSTNEFYEGSNYNYRWVFTNTATYSKMLGDVHRLTALIGTEAIRDGLGRGMDGQRQNYAFENDINTWTLGQGGSTGLRNNSWYNGEFALFGMFTRVDYALMNRYLLTGILRRDGVSRFQGDKRFGYFPSVSAGWRISEEGFMSGFGFISDLKIRAGVGTTGNAEIPRATNFATLFGSGANSSGYDINGSNTGVVTGYVRTQMGNPLTAWESAVMTNLGFDMSFFNYALNVNLDLYNRKTSGMLVTDQYTALAGMGNRPLSNVGDMRNTGVDLAVDFSNKLGELTYTIGMNISHYRNEVLKINEANARLFNGNSRFGNVTITEKGQPVGMFYGYQIEGFFENEEQVLNGAAHPNMNKDNPKTYVGKYKFKDIDGNKVIDANDNTYIGNPHPDFTGGLNLTLGYGRFDLYTYFYGSYGNDIYNYVKYWTDFYSFFGGRSRTVLNDSWEPGKTNARLPIIDAGDNISHRYSHSYYVEDGSFFRLKDLQLGYTIPAVQRLGISNLRIYVQASNLFTLTKYTGLDPDLSNRNFNSDADLQKGLDFGNYPVPRVFMGGINLSF